MKILIISPQTWTNHYISKQYYAMHLSKMGHEVFFLNPFTSIFNKNLLLYKIKKKRQINIKILDIKIFCPKIIKKISKRLFLYFLKFSIYLFHKFYSIKFDIVWNFDQDNYEVTKYFQSKKKIIHIVDPIKDKKNFYNMSKRIDLIIFIDIFFKIKNLAKKNLIIPHGLNFFFVKSLKKKIIQTNKPKKIGLYGNFLSGRFDLINIKKIIDNNEFLLFYFVGFNHTKHPYKNTILEAENFQIISELKKKKNVFFINNNNPRDLPKILKKIDIFLTILKPEYNINAHKILEIISTGKPMISSYFKYYKNNSELIYYPKNHSEKEFQKLLNKILFDYKKFFNSKLIKHRVNYVKNLNYNNHIKNILNEI